MTDKEIFTRYEMSPIRFTVLTYVLIFIFYRLISLAEKVFEFDIHWSIQAILSLIIASIIMARNSNECKESQKRN